VVWKVSSSQSQLLMASSNFHHQRQADHRGQSFSRQSFADTTAEDKSWFRPEHSSREEIHTREPPRKLLPYRPMGTAQNGTGQLIFVNHPYPMGTNFHHAAFDDPPQSFTSDGTGNIGPTGALFVPENAPVYIPPKSAKKAAAPRGRKPKPPANITPNPIQDLPVPRSEMVGRDGSPPQSMTSMLKFTNVVGRGRGMSHETTPEPPPRGKGRAARQGTRIDIPNPLRDAALAEEKSKRIKFTDDEPQDRSQEEKLKRFSPNDAEDKPVIKKAKASSEQSKASRSHHACDRCYRNKTKVCPPIFMLEMTC
jgi:hypothetical protein